jgi:hypothetical protein
MKPQELSNEELIEACKHIPLTTELDLKHIEELITRFERLSLGKQADEAIQEVIKLEQRSQQDDEVEALAEKFWLLPDNPTLENCFKNAERFINQRNERRGKNGK